jgi:hypothetical protein
VCQLFLWCFLPSWKHKLILFLWLVSLQLSLLQLIPSSLVISVTIEGGHQPTAPPALKRSVQSVISVCRERSVPVRSVSLRDPLCSASLSVPDYLYYLLHCLSASDLLKTKSLPSPPPPLVVDFLASCSSSAIESYLSSPARHPTRSLA